MKLFLEAMAKFLLGVALVGLCIFLSAGTVSYFNGWLLMGILFVPMLLAGVVMLWKDPGLLKSRLDGKEKAKEQSAVVKFSALMFLAGFLAAGFGVRFGWYLLPRALSFAGAGIFFAAYLVYAEVLRENRYLSRTVKVEKNQRVIDTGLYGVVRHPMYGATVLLFLAMPLVLGSVYSFLIFLCYPFIIAKRIRHEEAFLEKELEGYAEYQKKVKYRLIPYIW